jgi:antitoxin ParD1/3/4
MISVELGAKLEELVAELVAAGRYGSEAEVLREGLRLVQEREARLLGWERRDQPMSLPHE